MSSPKVDHVTPEVTRMVQLARPVRTLMGGTAAMRAAGEMYQPRYPAEPNDAYQSRLYRSFLFDATGKTVRDMTGKVFRKPVVLKDDVAEDIRQLAEDIDSTGRHLNVFARDVLFDGLQTGGGYIMVDAPPAVRRADGLPATLGDVKNAGWRPYLIYIPIENVFGWKSETVDGAETLTQFRIREYITEADGDFAEKVVEQIRVLERGKWSTYRKDARSGEWTLYDEGELSVQQICIVPVYLNRVEFMTFAPPLATLAEKNIEHWQSSSDQRNILSVARVPILFGSGFAETDKIAVGASSMIRASDPNATLAYVEHTGAAIQAGERDLQALVLQMQALGLQLLVDGQGGQTATGEIRDSEKENSPLAMMASALQDALEQAFGLMAEYLGLDPEKGGSVDVNHDFGISGNIAEVQYLTQAVIAGKLDNTTYLTELKRRGVLADDVETEVVLHRLDTAAPELGGGMNLHEH